MEKDYNQISKYSQYLFWLTIANMIVSLVQGQTSGHHHNSIETIASVATPIIAIAQLVVLFMLGKYNRNYRYSAILSISTTVLFIVGIVVCIPMVLNSGNSLGSVVITILLVMGLSGVLVILYNYFCIKAHREMLEEINHDFAHKWQKLWRYIIIAGVAFIIDLFIIARDRYFGFVVLLIIIIPGVLALVIMYMIYLYKMIGIFKQI